MFCSCTRPSPELHATKSIQINPSQVDIEKYVKNKSFTRLETNDQSIISKVDKIMIFNDEFYLLDSSSKSILVFNKNGNFIRKLNREGRGPGEYQKINDFSIDLENEQLIILSNVQNNLLLYNVNTFEYIKSIAFKEGLYPSFVECISKNNFALGKNHVCFNNEFNNSNFIVINSEGNVINEGAPFPVDLRNVLYSDQPFFNHIGQVFFSNPADRSVYSLNNKDLEIQKTQFDFGDLNITFPQRSGQENTEINFNEMVNRMTSLNRILNDYSGIFGPVSFLETKNHILIECIKEGQTVYIFYCKESLKSILVKPETNMVYGLPMIFVNIVSVSSDGESFISTVSPYRIKEISQSASKYADIINDKNFTLFELINEQIKESDNPILIKFALTKF